MQKILIVGSGGREHALAWSFKSDGETRTIYCAPGNAGISEVAECVDISATNIDDLLSFALKERIDLTFVGGETALALGIVDRFEDEGLKIIGPVKKAARLESSKFFAKEFMTRHSIPTASFASAGSFDEAVSLLETGMFGNEMSPVVVKADGLAAGKGVVVARSREEGKDACREIFDGNLVPEEAGELVVLEECLVGKEVSLIMFTDGSSFSLMPPTRDHKRIGEGETGRNTGGMGTITDPSLLSVFETNQIIKTIIKPTLEGAAAEGFSIKGILFLGLMMTADGPRVLEYNVRFGDPETQAILINLESDIYEICEAITNCNLDTVKIMWKEGSSACVILAAENYPRKPKTGDIIEGVDDANWDENVEIFHSGSAFDVDRNLVTAGGRVLGVTASASNMSNAMHRAYKAANKINWRGMYFRRDIGRS